MSRALGIGAALTAGVCLATGGIALRLLEAADGWQVLIYRGGALAAGIFAWMLLRYRGDTLQAFRRLGARGAFAAVVIGVVAVLYVFAILNTTVANTVVILSLSPLFTAAVAWLVLREPVGRATVASMGLALVGVIVMCADGLGGGLLGIVIALGAAACFSLFIVAVRGGRDVDMIPAIGLSGLVTVAIAAAMGGDLAISPRDAGIGVFLGVVQLACGYACITIATRHLAAARVNLLVLSELVFAPVFVWIGIGEVPSALGAAGGLVVVAAVLWQAWRALRAEEAVAVHD